MDTAKKVSKKKRSVRSKSMSEDKEAKPSKEKVAANIEVNDATFAAAIKDMFSDEEREDIIKEYNLMQSCKQAHKDIIIAAQALGLGDEFDGCAFAISHDGRFFPIEQEVFDEEYADYEADEDEEGEDDEDGEEYNATIIIRDLKKYMKKHNVNQTEMADKLGCSQAAVSTWLRDESNPRKKYCAQIANIIYTE